MPPSKVLLEVAAKVDEAVKGFDEIKGRMAATASEAEDLRAILAGMRQSFSGNNSALGTLTSALSQLETAVNTLIRALQEFKDSAKHAFAQAGQGAHTLGKEVKGAVRDIQSTNSKPALDLGKLKKDTMGNNASVLQGSDVFDPDLILKEAGDIGTRASAEFVRYFKEAQAAAQERMWKDTGKNLIPSDLIDGYENFSNITKKWCETQLKRVAAVITTIGGTISGVVKSSLDVGGGFETQMTRVKIISGATGSELDMLTQKAREMGESLPITAQEAAAAMELMAQRGTKARDILASVADVSNLAISQNVDMASAAELMGSTMTNFGIAIEDASKVTDIFNNASNQSALSMSKLSESLKYVAPMAATAGMSLEQTIAAMKVLANAGLGGEMIGTGLSMTLQKLAENSRILGVRTREADGTLRPLKDIFGELQTRGMNLAQATEIFGARASKAALNLVKYSHTLSENEANLRKWGSTQNAVTEQMGTWTNIKKALESAFEGVQLEIFSQIASDSKDAVKSVTELTKEVRKWVSETDIATKTLKALTDGLGFKIPTADGLKEFFKSFDVELFLERIRKFSQTAREGVTIISYFAKRFLFFIRMLLPWLDKFAQVTFWTWWLGNAAGIIGNFLNFANVMSKVASAIRKFPVTTLPKIMTFLSSLDSFIFSPVGAIVAGVAAVGGAAYYLY